MSLQSALLNASGALDAFSRVLDATQNNVANAATPGYAKQTQTLAALPFGPAAGGMGGVRAGEIQSARDQFAEQAVRRETTSMGWAQQQASSLTSVQSAFDISENSGIAGALNDLYSSFSAWGATPNDAAVRQSVIDSAGIAAQAFQQTSLALSNASDSAESQLRATVATVNRLTAAIAECNQKVSSSGPDAGVDAQINANLEQLSRYAGISAMPQPDGSVNVLLDGQVPLVLGGDQCSLSFSLDPSLQAPARIVSGGVDVTAHADAGQMGALLDVRNRLLPGLAGDAFQTGDLNTLARQFADRVNTLMGPGCALFAYDASNPAATAQTLSVDPAATAAGLSNGAGGAATALSGLTSEKQDVLGGATFIEFYAQMASKVGSELSAATANSQNADSAVAQAQSLRQQMSGVSIDDEAMVVVQFQRAYEANSKLITILDQLTQDAINMMPSS